MRCHYEVLNIPRDADSAEIKTAYKKLALKWHPDKNLDNVENAKEEFLLIQQAYEVLSDFQERAWYDNHREQILRGRGSDFEDNFLDVYQYFTTTCFKGFGDGEGDFYAVYGKVFENIAKEDIAFMDHKEEIDNIPKFGNSQSKYEDIVKPFYDYWLHYCTRKSYTWVDLYNINAIHDRRTFKLMEKENKKVRQKAKKERNEEVRALVAYVRKRDKRVQANSKLMEARILENREKQEKLRRQKLKQNQEQLLNSGAQAEWTKFDLVKEELEAIEKHLAEEFGEKLTSEEENESVDDNFYCVACNKLFKTSKSFKNHELSKKHIENAEILKFYIENEEELESEETRAELEQDNEINDLISESDASAEEVKAKNKKKKKSKSIKVSLSDHENMMDSRQLQSTNTENLESDDDFTFDSSKKRHNKKNKTPSNKRKSKNVQEVCNNSNSNEANDNVEDNVEEFEEKVPYVKSKKSNKRGKQKPQSVINESVVDINHCCVTCNSNFLSKNKLFDHLKKTGHGVYLPQNTPSAKSKRKAVLE